MPILLFLSMLTKGRTLLRRECKGEVVAHSERGWCVTDSYTQAEYDFAAQLVAKALANRENAPRLLRKSK